MDFRKAVARSAPLAEPNTHSKRPRQALVEGGAGALEPCGGPAAHEHAEGVAAGVAGAIQAFAEMLAVRIRIMRPGSEAGGEIVRQAGIEDPLYFLDYGLGNGVGHKHGLALPQRCAAKTPGSG